MDRLLTAREYNKGLEKVSSDNFSALFRHTNQSISWRVINKMLVGGQYNLAQILQSNTVQSLLRKTHKLNNLLQSELDLSHITQDSGIDLRVHTKGTFLGIEFSAPIGDTEITPNELNSSLRQICYDVGIRYEGLDQND